MSPRCPSFLLLSFAVLLTAPIPCQPVTLSGTDKELYDNIHTRYCPVVLPDPAQVTDILFEACSAQGESSFVDPFSGATLSRGHAFPLIEIMPLQWWAQADATPKGNLYNILPCSEGSEHKKLHIPGDVTKPNFNNGLWATGAGPLQGVMTPMWSPPKTLRGDVARAMMYIACVYPCRLASAEGCTVITDNGYPGLRPYAVALLMKWHNEDPVDEAERRRNAIISSYQLASNPFVDDPELAEYLWGDRQGQQYKGEEEDPPISDLKGHYSRATDRAVSLNCPYIPANARWSVDGNPIEGLTLLLDTLTLGLHQLTFTVPASEMKGSLTISVEP